MKPFLLFCFLDKFIWTETRMIQEQPCASVIDALTSSHILNLLGPGYANIRLKKNTEVQERPIFQGFVWSSFKIMLSQSWFVRKSRKGSLLNDYMFIYIYICIFTNRYIYMYIYIYTYKSIQIYTSPLYSHHIPILSHAITISST